MDSENEISEILRRAEETLAIAYCGLKMMDDPQHTAYNFGLRNVITFSRSVTFVIQNIRGKHPDFEEWYNHQQSMMKSDPVFLYFKDARNNLEKQGRLDVTHSSTLYDSRQLEKLAPFAPPGATGFFIGDEFGGSGWTVPTLSGGMHKFYVVLPTSVGKVEQYFYGTLADQHLGDSSQNTYDLATQYLGKLRSILDDAKNKFAPNQKKDLSDPPKGAHLRIVK